MMKIDTAILTTSQNICKNIDRFDASERGLLSQNILSQLRNFVEYIAIKLYANGNDIDPNTYQNNTQALEFIHTRGNYRFLSKFHALLQISASHYTLDEGQSERLMLKYYEYLLRIKIFLSEKYALEVLDNIEKFPLNNDSKLMEYYEKIADRLDKIPLKQVDRISSDRFYIQKIKPFFINHKIYYEVTFTIASDYTSKFDRIIAFTKLDMSHNYAVKLSIRHDGIKIMGKTMPIRVIDDWEVSVRPCELDNYADLFGSHTRITGSGAEYRELMSFLTETRMSFVDLVVSSDSYFAHIKELITKHAKALHFFEVLEKSREIIKTNKAGANIIRYLLFKLNNKVIRAQFTNEACGRLSYLFLEYGCIPFDQMPFATSLMNHNPKLSDLFECLNPSGREHELFARLIKNNTENNGILYTTKKDMSGFENVDTLIAKYNKALYKTHGHRKIEEYKEHFFIKGYEEDCIAIIQKLQELSTSGIGDYRNSVESWLQDSSNHEIDCDEKKAALKQMFEDSYVSLIYGSAGTGKSTLINHISKFFNDEVKIYIANTNPAVDNLRRKVKTNNSSFKTIKKFLAKKHEMKCDVLIIDECSTVNNADMKKILENAKFRLLILVGDTFQIESIVFGNWFNIARFFLPSKSVSELTRPYRTTNPALLTVWDKVRKLDDAMLEPLVKNDYSVELDESIFERSDDDQIILCLAYDGLYGINNINRFLQGNNPNKAISWGINIYKVDDPILFNESNRFAPLIYNNLKGKIVGIERSENEIQFDIEIDKAINEFQAEEYDFELIGISEKRNSIIRFIVHKNGNVDEDDDMPSEAVVPFQIAYAISIHKAQGLEYSSVKVIINDGIEELVTHNIFYTAITRAKEKLKIYWTPETEKRVLQNLKIRDDKKDARLLALKYNLTFI
ncbi:ATP-dependent DNA helicase [Sulfurospirillum cavolei]|uniref:ATP-dependent DNA helicase n=1 Tax=Sulfurospirillum cavolei TaxID=366522 RepID=UPI0007649AFB|nr:ATP-dependent RecD-like DNA helicase [Sulfurospirillum cavolei]